MTRTHHAIAVFVLALAPPAAQAEWFQDSRRVMLQYGPYTHHYNDDPDHENRTRLIGLEWEFRPQWIAGATSFRNSFDQPSQYLYAGRRWPVRWFDENAYLKLSGGLLLGYKRPYDDNIPLNANGVALAALPALGYQFDRFSVQLNILGTAGVIVTFGYDVLQWD